MTYSLAPRITLAIALLAAAVFTFTPDAVQAVITLCHEGFEIQ
jgi:hypothetical protein